MIREVYINNQLIDIEAENVAGYIFYSPIFRDISKIVSNRTTTYKIPKTTKNLSIFGLADNPDVASLAPYREHTFKEYRDGLPFIEGICRLLKSAEKELELAVFWGNSEKLQALKDIKLRDLRFKQEDYQDENGNEKEGYRYVNWNEDSPFLTAASTNKSGFLKVDFGRGVDSMQFIHPCVNILYILDLIKSSTGIAIEYGDYPKDFATIFKDKWFPLIDKTANSITWDSVKYTMINQINEVKSLIWNFSSFIFKYQDTGLVGFTTIKAKANSISGINIGDVFLKSNNIDSNTYEARIYLSDGETVLAESISDSYVDNDGKATIRFNLTNTPILTNVSSDMELYVRGSIRKKGTTQWGAMLGFSIQESIPASIVQVVVRFNEVRFGDKFPIIQNLPDLSVLDFLKSLMSMYGLFTYHDFKVEADVVKFVSIDEMYSYKYEKDNLMKYQAYDWTNKLILFSSGSRMNLEYTYGEYAQKNNLKYKNDKDVNINADGYIQLDNQTLEKEKDLIELPYSPSNNVTDEFDNRFAEIPLYDDEGKYSSAGVRILNEVIYDKEGLNEALKSASFNEALYFSGNEGLIKSFYSKYQAVMLHPVVVECAVYLSDIELHLYKEINPIYIDGVYYMPITITVQTNGVAKCKAIKMPYNEKLSK